MISDLPTVLGVDGGGSKTVARLMRVPPSGPLCVLGEGSALGSNPLSVGRAAARAAISDAVRGAYESSGFEGLADKAVLAIAGCASAGVAQDLQAWASGADLANSVGVVDDTQPVLASVPSDSAAIGLIAGTGSAAIARPAHGEPVVLGGWGYLIDDAGSGFDLGRRGLRHGVRHFDRSGETSDPLTAAAFRYSGASDVAALKEFVYGDSDARRRIAWFAADVLRLATDGSSDAVAIIQSGADALAELVLHAWERIGEPINPRPPILLSGGLFERAGAYRRLVSQRLQNLGWPPDAVRLSHDAATGCCLLAAARLRR